MRRGIWMVLLLLCLALCGPAVLAEEQAEYKPYEFGLSQQELAGKAYDAKDWIQAIIHLENYLIVEPKDQSARYNLACCYALAGQVEKALENWEKAVDAGWTDFQHATEDPDLESIRQDPRFAAALKRSEANAEVEQKKGPQDFRREYLPMKALWTYIVALPPDYEQSKASYPLVLVLHGSGSSETGHGAIADELGRDGVIYVCPRAPYPHPEVFMQFKKAGYCSHFPDQLDENSAAAKQLLPQYVDWIFACADDARHKYRVKGDRVFILGHSEGAFAANACALLYPKRVQSYFSYAGGIPKSLAQDELAKGLKKQGVKPYLVHCQADPVVEVQASIDAGALLAKNGVDYQLTLLDGGMHPFTKEAAECAKAWLKTEVLGGK